MPESVSLDEQDLDLISALQIAPRAPWSLIGDVLGVDAATAARRWERLRTAGAAWLSCFPGPRYQPAVCTAFIEMSCARGQVHDVARRTSQLPSVITTEHVTGGRDLYLTAMVGDLSELTELLLGDLHDLPGVHTTRANVATQLITEGGDWKLGGLGPAEQDRLKRSRPAAADTPLPALRPVDWQLARYLARNARASYAELAEHAEISASTARRRVDALLGSGIISIRCDVSRELAGVPTSATVWASIPPTQLDRITQSIAALAETRLCAGITGGPANLLFTVWLRTPSELQTLEGRLSDQFPQLSIIDRALGLRHVKRVGQLLGHRELAGDAIPLAIWSR